jgi:hypothetical protein
MWQCLIGRQTRLCDTPRAAAIVRRATSETRDQCLCYQCFSIPRNARVRAARTAVGARRQRLRGSHAALQYRMEPRSAALSGENISRSIRLPGMAAAIGYGSVTTGTCWGVVSWRSRAGARGLVAAEPAGVVGAWRGVLAPGACGRVRPSRRRQCAGRAACALARRGSRSRPVDALASRRLCRRDRALFLRRARAVAVGERRACARSGGRHHPGQGAPGGLSALLGLTRPCAVDLRLSSDRDKGPPWWGKADFRVHRSLLLRPPTKSTRQPAESSNCAALRCA